MAWRIELTDSACRALQEPGPQTARRIAIDLRERFATADESRHDAKSLQRDLRECWLFRVGDYRLVFDIQDGVLRVLVFRIANRKQLYSRR